MSLIRFQDYQPGLFDRFFDKDMFDWTNKNFSNTNTTIPSINIKENIEGFEVEVAAPGFEKNDFNIELNNNILTISSDKKVENEQNDDNQFTKREFSYQSFARSFTLPITIERERKFQPSTIMAF